EKLAQVPQRLREERRSGRRAATSSADEPWLWFVVDEATPGPQALADLLHLAADSPNTAVVGPKRVRFSGTGAAAADPAQRSAEQADTLVDVRITLTHGGRIITGAGPGETAQRQVAWRQGGLAVPRPRTLIREAAWTRTCPPPGRRSTCAIASGGTGNGSRCSPMPGCCSPTRKVLAGNGCRNSAPDSCCCS